MISIAIAAELKRTWRPRVKGAVMLVLSVLNLAGVDYEIRRPMTQTEAESFMAQVEADQMENVRIMRETIENGSPIRTGLE